MSRLPDEFVKAPAPKRSTKRRAPATPGKTASRTALALTGEVVLVLGDEERRALGAALDELRRAGQEITIEQMVSRVIADWMTARTAPKAQPFTLEAAVAQVMRLARSPLRTWRELGATLRRAAGTASAF